MDTDRDLLFAVLALQADLINTQQFAEACTLYTSRKTASMAEILLERGWLTATDRSLLEMLLQRKLKKHGGDAHASLAAAANDEVCRVLAVLNDPILDRSLAGLPHVNNPIVLSTLVPSAESRERYRLTRLHATGGLGRVWLALDGDLGREVALKELRPEAGVHSALGARFLEEARITGQLEHPGIVPVYELARRSQDQQPFYTMRFIRGRTLDEAIRAYHDRRKKREAGPLELRELLGAFVAVCNAVAYAHSRGIIHRDLKGQNVVLGDFGEVVVLDWGLAKVIGQSDPDQAPPPVILEPSAQRTETVQGEVMGTPAYMAPEQAEGRLDLLGPRTDVYGLGAILYELLTGEPPFTGSSTDEVLQKVRREEPARPRQVCPEVPPALEAICLRALARKPADRYPAAKELAQEVQRWLADEPVTVYRESLTTRLGRWARRHKPIVAGAAALLVTAVVALTVSTVLIGRQKARTEKAQAQALANFRLARDAIDHFYTQVSEEALLNEPGLQPLRKELLQTARDFYQKFHDDQKDDPTLQADRGKALIRLARITSEIDSTPQALQQLEEARTIFEKLVNAEPELADHQSELARCYNLQGLLHQAQGEVALAEAAHAKALQVQQPLAERHPGEPPYQGALGLYYNNLGVHYRNTSQPAKARAAYGEALKVQEKLVGGQEGLAGAPYRRDLAGTYANLASVLTEVGELAEAEGAFKKTLQIREALAASNPKSLEAQSDLAATYNNLGNWYEKTNRPGPAEAAFKEAVAVREQLVHRNPTVSRYRRELANSYANLGNLYYRAGKTKPAAALYQKALQAREKLAGDHPAVHAFAVAVGGSHGDLGNVLFDERDFPAALAAYDRAVARLKDLLQPEKPDPAARHYLRTAHWGRAATLIELNRPAEALADWDRVIELADERTRPEFRLQRALTLARVKEPFKATTEVEELLKPKDVTAATFYSAACVYALAAATASDERQAEQYAERAVELLRQAVGRGYKHVKPLKENKDLDALRSRPDFQKLLAELEKKPT